MTTIREARTLSDAILVLPVRNEARLFMTRHREPITIEQQERWFEQWVLTGQKSLYVVEHTVSSEKFPGSKVVETIGYGLISWDPDPEATYAALTAALVPAVRGAGYGRMIFSFLVSETRIAKKVPWIEVLASNAAARSLYHKLGFVEIGRGQTDPARVAGEVRSDEVISMIHAR